MITPHARDARQPHRIGDPAPCARHQPAATAVRVFAGRAAVRAALILASLGPCIALAQGENERDLKPVPSEQTKPNPRLNFEPPPVPEFMLRPPPRPLSHEEMARQAEEAAARARAARSAKPAASAESPPEDRRER